MTGWQCSMGIDCSPSSIEVSIPFFPLFLPTVVPKRWFFNVLTIIQNSLEAINTLDPPSIARNACLSRSSLQMPFFRNLILVLLLPLVSWTGTWGVHACRACYDNWTSNWMVGDEGVYKCPMWSRALGPWYTHCMCIMWNGPWFLQISIDSMLVA